jgi:hypothetical protein
MAGRALARAIEDLEAAAADDSAVG